MGMWLCMCGRQNVCKCAVCVCIRMYGFCLRGQNVYCRGDPFDTCGSAPCTNAGMSSLLNPNSVIPFGIPMSCIYSRSTSANTRPASLLFTLAVLAPGWEGGMVR